MASETSTKTQSGITIAEVNAPFTIVKDLPVPVPGPDQLLVKSLVVGINPVESFMYHTGILVTSFPAILGSDVSGIVLSVGSAVTKFAPGDYVYGCVRVGQNSYSPFQETFLMDEGLAFRKTDGMTVAEAAGVGAGVLTAALCITTGLSLPLPSPDTPTEPKGEWLIVTGGSGTVGQYGIQLAKLAGYRVMASCSASKSSIALAAGAEATFDYKLSLDKQLAEIGRVTSGKFSRFFDASAQGYELAMKALQEVSLAGKEGGKVYFSTVDDWTPMSTPASIAEYRVHLGVLGRDDGSDGTQTTADVRKLIPGLETLLKAGAVKPVSHVVVGEGTTGWDRVKEGIALLEAGGDKQGRKLVVKVAEE